MIQLLLLAAVFVLYVLGMYFLAPLDPFYVLRTGFTGCCLIAFGCIGRYHVREMDARQK